MRYSLFAGAIALASNAAAAPHAAPHGHAHLHKRQAVVTHFVTVTANGPAPTPQPDWNPDWQENVALPNGGAVDGGADRGPDGPGAGADPGPDLGGGDGCVGGCEFTPGGFTPRVTATGAKAYTLANGKVSISHLEQTLGLSTQVRGAGSAGTPVPAAEANVPAGSPMRFSSDPSGGPPTHDFEVIANLPHQPGPNNRDYPGTILLQTNFHRRNQSAGDLIWGFALQRIAMDIAHTCNFQHDITREGGGYGQSLVAGVPADNIGKAITDTFYNPQVNAFDGLYGQATPDFSNFDNWGFFTQTVWKSTQQIGCYTVDCSQQGGLKGSPGGDDFTVCNYWPAGNIDGQYAENVGQQGNMESMSWDCDSWPCGHVGTNAEGPV